MAQITTRWRPQSFFDTSKMQGPDAMLKALDTAMRITFDSIYKLENQVGVTDPPITGQNNTQAIAANTAALASQGLTLITDTRLEAAATNITFSAIPGTYKGLRILLTGRTDAAGASDHVLIQFNGDTGGNYDAQALSGSNVTAAAAASAGGSFQSVGQIVAGGATRANAAGSVEITIQGYADTVFEKSALSQAGAVDSTVANDSVEVRSVAWRSTAAITSIKLFPNSGTNFVTGTRATLYGMG